MSCARLLHTSNELYLLGFGYSLESGLTNRKKINLDFGTKKNVTLVRKRKGKEDRMCIEFVQFVKFIIFLLFLPLLLLTTLLGCFLWVIIFPFALCMVPCESIESILIAFRFFD